MVVVIDPAPRTTERYVAFVARDGQGREAMERALVAAPTPDLPALLDTEARRRRSL